MWLGLKLALQDAGLYWNPRVTGPGSGSDDLQMETGDFILLENGDFILLE